MDRAVNEKLVRLVAEAGVLESIEHIRDLEHSRRKNFGVFVDRGTEDANLHAFYHPIQKLQN